MSAICDAYKKVDGEQLYNSVHRENQHPERLSCPGERERNAVMAIRVGVNMLQFCSVSNSPLSQ